MMANNKFVDNCKIQNSQIYHLNKSEYSNSKALDKYNEIFNSSLISASIKERVKND